MIVGGAEVPKADNADAGVDMPFQVKPSFCLSSPSPMNAESNAHIDLTSLLPSLSVAAPFFPYRVFSASRAFPVSSFGQWLMVFVAINHQSSVF